MHHLPRSRFLMLVMTLVVILCFAFGSLPMMHSTARAQISESPQEARFIISSAGGGPVCREATPEESQLFATASRENLHILRSINPNQSQGLKIILRATPQLEANLPAKAGFQRAAADWESRISTPITLVMDVDYGPTAFGVPFTNDQVLGFAYIPLFNQGYPGVRNALLSRAVGVQDVMVYPLLPEASIPTDIGSVNVAALTTPQLRALGYMSATADPTAEAVNTIPQVGYNSLARYDFDPDDGIDPDKLDFVGACTHEIGHILGFMSRVGALELNPSDTKNATIWDFYRFRPGVSLSNFTTSNRILSSGGSQVYFIGAQAPLSTGRPDGSGGDGNKGGHWQSRDFAKQYIGIADPRFPRGTRNQITNNDLRAMDSLGYTLTTPVDQGDTIPPVVSSVIPSEGESFTVGDQTTITWISSDNVVVTLHNIEFSTDFGQTFNPVATGLVGTAQSYLWTIPPGSETTNGLIRVTARDMSFNTGSAVSGKFTVLPETPVPPTVQVATPNGGEIFKAGTTIDITWQAYGDNPIVSQTVLLSMDGGVTYTQIAGNLDGRVRSLSYPTPRDLPRTRKARIQVTARDSVGSEGHDESNSDFVIKAKK